MEKSMVHYGQASLAVAKYVDRPTPTIGVVEKARINVMNRRILLKLLIGTVIGLRSLIPVGSRASSITNGQNEDDLLIVNGWIVRRSQLSRKDRP